jgi:hypothetical protein
LERLKVNVASLELGLDKFILLYSLYIKNGFLWSLLNHGSGEVMDHSSCGAKLTHFFVCSQRCFFLRSNAVADFLLIARLEEIKPNLTSTIDFTLVLAILMETEPTY